MVLNGHSLNKFSGKVWLIKSGESVGKISSEDLSKFFSQSSLFQLFIPEILLFLYLSFCPWHYCNIFILLAGEGLS